MLLLITGSILSPVFLFVFLTYNHTVFAGTFHCCRGTLSLLCASPAVLEQLTGQLGPVGVAIEAKLKAIEDEGLRAKVQKLRDTSVTIYNRLTVFTQTETEIRAGLLKAWKVRLCA